MKDIFTWSVPIVENVIRNGDIVFASLDILALHVVDKHVHALDMVRAKQLKI